LGTTLLHSRALVGFGIFCVIAKALDVGPVPVELLLKLRGSLEHERSEELVIFSQQEGLGVEEVIENAVGGKRNNFSKLVVIIVFASDDIRKVGVCLVDFDELLLGFGIGAVLGVVLQGEVTIGLLNILIVSILWHTKNFIIRPSSVGVLLVEELPLTLMSEAVLIIELLESSIGILSAVLVHKLIIVITSGRV
jgi:hypothetical protein